MNISKISSRAALVCLVAASVVLTNGISVSALEASNLSETTVNQIGRVQNRSHEFLIDSELKAYSDINKVQDVAGFDFKLPDNILQGNKPGAYQVIKISDSTNGVQIFFDNYDQKSNNEFSLRIFKGDPVEALRNMDKAHKSITSISKVESHVEEISIGSLKGKNVTLTINTPEETFEEYTLPASQETEKYFVWENDGVYYAIEFGITYKEDTSTLKTNNNEKILLSNEELETIAESLESLKNIKNVDYKTGLKENEELSTEVGIMSIYDKDDLKKAEEILGFNPKMPLKITDDIFIDDSGVGITGDSDVDNKKINYELNLFYNYGNGRITFNQSNHDSFNDYKSIKENGYVDKSDNDWAVNKKINVDKMNVEGNTVYKYIESFKNTEEDEVSSDVIYTWEENGVYCSVVFFDKDQYQDEIAKEFITSKTID
ncbi:MAG: hypothetical protein Q4F66_01995 [Clostridium sp.]|nr:hypothetical protein [Clostridium sp.]